MTSLYESLMARGLVQDATPQAADCLNRAPVRGYVGFDPTAPSLHVGNLIPVMCLAWLQRAGGTPFALVGGGTGLVGDPSGKRNERPMLDPDTVAANAAGLAAQLRRFLDFSGPNAAQVLDNADWLSNTGLMPFLRDVGKHFTVNYMLQKESVRSRMEAGISFTEFTYMLVQAYDFWHLWRHHDVEVQLGGSDQWGNITAGVELISRREGATAHGIVAPLLTTAGGGKFGKSEAGNIWLDPNRTSPYHFYQFWLNVDDRDAERSLRLFTFLPLDRIAEIMKRQSADPSRREAQRELAREVTTMVHGSDEADRASRASEAAFSGGPVTDYEALAGTMPNCTIAEDELRAGIPLVDLLVRAGLASSKGDARRVLAARGFSVNDVQQDDVARIVTTGDVQAGRYLLLRKGKKNYVMAVLDTSG